MMVQKFPHQFLIIIIKKHTSISIINIGFSISVQNNFIDMPHNVKKFAKYIFTAKLHT